MLLGSIIQSRRRDLHITGPELARRIQVTKGTISQIELGIIKDPSSTVLYKISKTLGLNLEDLIKVVLSDPTAVRVNKTKI